MTSFPTENKFSKLGEYHMTQTRHVNELKDEMFEQLTITLSLKLPLSHSKYNAKF